RPLLGSRPAAYRRSFPTHMIKVVLFDLGNVILPVDGSRMAQKLKKHSPLPIEKILESFGNANIINPFEVGKITEEAFFDLIAEASQIKGLAFPQFVEYFNDIFAEDKRVTDIIINLKKTHKLGLISNTNS